MIRPYVSVIIPVYNQLGLLQKCLTALENQTYPSELYEVIVVDNGSKENVKSLANQYPQIVLTRELRPGSYAARNKGISLAKGDVLAFTDADCIPAEDWIKKGVARLLQNEKFRIIGGKITHQFKQQNKPNIIELFDSSTYLQQKIYIEEKGYLCTANMITYRRVVDDVGRFDASLYSGGDHEWCVRALKSGYKLAYADDVCITHPSRWNYKSICRKYIRVTGGVIERLRKGDQLPQTYFWHSLKELRPPIGLIFRIWNKSNTLYDLSIKQRIQMVLLAIFLRYSRALEIIRLFFGGKPKRI